MRYKYAFTISILLGFRADTKPEEKGDVYRFAQLDELIYIYRISLKEIPTNQSDIKRYLLKTIMATDGKERSEIFQKIDINIDQAIYLKKTGNLYEKGWLINLIYPTENVLVKIR